MNEITVANNGQIVSQANSDTHLMALWLHGKSEHSQRAYQSDVTRFMDHLDGKELGQATLQDLQDFVDSLDGSDNTRKRIVSSVKSLFTFGQKIGYLQFNVAAAIKAPKPKNTLAERILAEGEVIAMVNAADTTRDRMIIELLYASAGRVSEIAGLKWRDVQPNGNSGQVTLFGKGNETRAVKLQSSTYQRLLELRGDADADDPVFTSRKGGHMDVSAIRRVVTKVAKLAKIEGKVSPHWFRHSHASHALDRGTGVQLVRDTLGHSSLQITSRYAHAKPDDSSALHLVSFGR